MNNIWDRWKKNREEKKRRTWASNGNIDDQKLYHSLRTASTHMYIAWRDSCFSRYLTPPRLLLLTCSTESAVDRRRQSTRDLPLICHVGVSVRTLMGVRGMLQQCVYWVPKRVPEEKAQEKPKVDAANIVDYDGRRLPHHSDCQRRPDSHQQPRTTIIRRRLLNAGITQKSPLKLAAPKLIRSDLPSERFQQINHLELPPPERLSLFSR